MQLDDVLRRLHSTLNRLLPGDSSSLVLIQGDENMSDKIEMPRGIGAEVQQKGALARRAALLERVELADNLQAALDRLSNA